MYGLKRRHCTDRYRTILYPRGTSEPGALRLCVCVQEIAPRCKCCKRVTDACGTRALQCPLCCKHWRTQCAQTLSSYVLGSQASRSKFADEHGWLLHDLQSRIPGYMVGRVNSCWEALTTQNPSALSAQQSLSHAAPSSSSSSSSSAAPTRLGLGKQPAECKLR